MASEFAGWMQMMKLSQTVLEFDKTLWVHYGGGVEIKDKGTTLALTGKEEEAYLKVLNHFGRVMKLYTFDDGRWVDAETGLPATPFDESLAGRLPHPVNLPAEKKGEMGKKVKMGGNAKKGKSVKSGKAGSQDKPKAQAAKSRKSSKTTKLTAKPKTAAKAADGARKSKAAGASKSSRGTTGGAKQGKDAKGK